MVDLSVLHSLLSMGSTVSVIIPAHNAGMHLAQSLPALRRSSVDVAELLVVDDGSNDNTRELASRFGAVVLDTGSRRGPAFARNLGASAAAGDLLLFLDADVCVKPDTIGRILERFEADSSLDALMGSYDSTPDSREFLSQYRNLMHSYVHHTGMQRACTFWSGCGAIRRKVFLEHRGFSDGYQRPAIEDIELGYRLSHAGRRILLDPSIHVTHLKRWTFWQLVRTDMLDRGIPWTELILRDRFMPNDLNLQLSQRVSVVLVFLLVIMALVIAVHEGGFLLVPPLTVLFLMLGSWWGEVGVSTRPRRAALMMNGTVLLIALLAYANRMFGLIPALVLSPALLFLRHRYSKVGKIRRLNRWFGILFILLSVSIAACYLPFHRSIMVCIVLIAVVGLLNSQFYVFLAGKRGLAFMLAAIPFHFLYHFYNGLSFMIGVVRFYARRRPVVTPETAPAALKQGGRTAVL